MKLMSSFLLLWELEDSGIAAIDHGVEQCTLKCNCTLKFNCGGLSEWKNSGSVRWRAVYHAGLLRMLFMYQMHILHTICHVSTLPCTSVHMVCLNKWPKHHLACHSLYLAHECTCLLCMCLIWYTTHHLAQVWLSLGMLDIVTSGIYIDAL